MDCTALKCFILGTKMLSFTSTGIVAKRPLCRPDSMGRLQALPSPAGLKGRLWQTNVFQDGSHETHAVFRGAGFKEVFGLGRFSHSLCPLLIWEGEAAPPNLCAVPAAGGSAFTRLLDPVSFLQVIKGSQERKAGAFSWLNFIFVCVWGGWWSGCVYVNVRVQRISNVTFARECYWEHCWGLSVSLRTETRGFVCRL